jgi:hypothetical protein
MAESPQPVDIHDVLERLAALPISTWSYLWDNGEIRHMGPMAQDFYAAFSLGADQTRIEIADGQGVALAAIQALNELVRRNEADIQALQERLDRIA